MNRKRYIIAAVIFAFLLGKLPSILHFLAQYSNLPISEWMLIRAEITRHISTIVSIVKNSLHIFLFGYILIVSFILFLEGNNPDRTLLWISIFIFVPFFGLLIYLFVGPSFESFRRRRQFRLKKQKAVHRNGTKSGLLTENLLYSITNAKVMNKNIIKVFVSGEELFADIKESIKNAKNFIHIQTFILCDDELGNELRELLLEALKRGVKVKILYDAIGSYKITKRFVKSLRDAGAQCLSFMPIAFPMFRRQMNYRNHRKIMIFDGETAYTGGYNISDSYIGKGPLGNWRDTHVKIIGETVKKIHDIFLSDWQERTKQSAAKVRKTDHCIYPAVSENLPDIPMQIVPSGVSEPWHAIKLGYLSMISRAKERLWITSPYLVPGSSLMSALKNAALSGVDVRILIPKAKDHFLVHWGSRAQIEELLISGVRIYRYFNGFIHAKTLVADNKICSVGSCNMDIRSLEINFEDQLFIYDTNTTELFAKQFKKDLKDSEEILLMDWLKRPVLHKLLESFGKLYSAQI